MEEKIRFEYSLFRDGTPDHIEEIDDIDFVINTLVNLSIFRPHKHELIFELHQKYSEKEGFREKFLERALKMNSNFVNILIEKNIYCSDDIALLHGIGIETDDIIDLSNKINQTDYVQNDICQNALDLSLELIQTQYSPGTIEYCLKYDDIKGIHRIYQDPNFFQDEANIIDVENIMNLNFDLLGFCGFFGSVNCFKYFLETKQFVIDQSVIECVVCGGSIEIFRLCLQTIDISEYISKLILLASCYNNLDLLCFFHENGADLTQKEDLKKAPLHFAAENGHLSVVEYLVNQKADINDKDIMFLYLIKLLFIMLLKMVILVLLNI